MFQKALLLTLACLGAPAASAHADVITDWNEKAVAFVTPKMPPPQAHRVTAIMHVAMFDAVNSIDRRYRPYLTQLPAAPTTSREATAAAAAGTVLVKLNPAAAGEFKTTLDAYLAPIPDGVAKAEAIKLGEAVAAKILEARQSVAIPPGAADLACERTMGRRSQRDQGLRKQGERQAHGTAD